MLADNDSRAPPCSTSVSGFQSLILCVALGALGAGTARADPVNLTYTGNGRGQVVHVYLGAQSLDVFAGRLNHSASGGSGSMTGLPANVVTFCTDILQGHASGPSVYNSSSAALLSGNAGLTTLGTAKQQAIYDLYQAAGNLQFTQFEGFAAAFQLALWEVANDFNAALPNHGLSMNGGTFRATSVGQTWLSAALSAKVEYLLGAVGTGAAQNGLMGLRSDQYQDQLYAAAVIVPVPPAVWVGISGLVIAAGVQWRRRWEQTQNLWMA